MGSGRHAMTIKAWGLCVALPLLVLLLSFPFDLRSEFYKYVDENGKTIFVDDPSKIPPEHKEDVKSYRQKYDHLPADERARLLEKERKELEAFRKEEIARARAYVSRKTRVIVRDNQVLVPVLVGYDGREVETLLLLDTGASIMTLHREVAEKLRIKEFQKARMTVAGGQQIDADVALLSYVGVGPHKREGLHAAIIDHGGGSAGFQGLLGMNFLRGLKYNVNFDMQQIEWKR